MGLGFCGFSVFGFGVFGFGFVGLVVYGFWISGVWFCRVGLSGCRSSGASSSPDLEPSPFDPPCLQASVFWESVPSKGNCVDAVRQSGCARHNA